MGALPLEGIRILAITQFGAGPFATLQLADMGADVINIEDPANGDELRVTPPGVSGKDSLTYQSLNRNKRGITINLKHPDGYAAFRDLVRVSDAVVNNLRGDLPAKLGVDYAALRDVNPRVVCCSLSGYGNSGPRAAEPGFDYLVQAEAGWMAMTGEPGTPPTRVGLSAVDFSTGYATAMALLMGLVHVQRSGEGLDVEITLLGAARAMMNYLAASYFATGSTPARVAASGHGTVVPSQVFATKDGHMMVMCQKERFWRVLCERLDAPELLADERYAGFAGRLAHKEELMANLQARFAQRPTSEWLALLKGHVPVASIPAFGEAMELAASEPGATVVVDHPVFGQMREMASPVRVAGAEPPAQPAPSFGEHTDAILRGLLGYDEDRIARLREAGAI